MVRILSRSIFVVVVLCSLAAFSFDATCHAAKTEWTATTLPCDMTMEQIRAGIGRNNLLAVQWDGDDYHVVDNLLTGHTYLFNTTEPWNSGQFCSQTRAEYVITLDPGWNLIGSPTYSLPASVFDMPGDDVQPVIFLNNQAPYKLNEYGLWLYPTTRVWLYAEQKTDIRLAVPKIIDFNVRNPNQFVQLLIVGETYPVKAEVLREGYSSKYFIVPEQWRSSNPEVAEIDARGNIKAISPGVTVISAYADGTVSKPFAVRVLQPSNYESLMVRIVNPGTMTDAEMCAKTGSIDKKKASTNITFAKSAFTKSLRVYGIYPGLTEEDGVDSETAACRRVEDITDKVSVTSGNETVALIQGKDVVVNSEGQAAITARLNDGTENTTFFDFKMLKPYAMNIYTCINSYNPTAMEYNECCQAAMKVSLSERPTFTGIYKYYGAADMFLGSEATYHIRPDGLAEVQGGVLVPRATGTVTITATGYYGLSDDVQIEIVSDNIFEIFPTFFKSGSVAVPIEKDRTGNQVANITTNKKLILTAIAKPSLGNTYDISDLAAWHSDNESVGQMKGYVFEPASPGTASVYAEYGGVKSRVLIINVSAAAGGAGMGQKMSRQTVLAVDCSGSMKDTDPRNLRLEAAKYFVDLASQGDYVGFLCFSNNIDIAQDPRLILTNEDRNGIKQIIMTSKSNGGTGIALALQAAYTLMYLSKGPEQRSVLLLSDGGNTASSDPSRMCEAFARNNWPVNTIGFSDQADMEWLKNCSSQSLGRSESVLAAGTLPAVYGMLSAIIGRENIISNFGITPATLSKSFTVSVPGGAGEAKFSISSSEAMGASLILTSPGGISYEKASLPEGAEWFQGDVYQGFRIANPQPGEWRIGSVNSAADGGFFKSSQRSAASESGGEADISLLITTR